MATKLRPRRPGPTPRATRWPTSRCSDASCVIGYVVAGFLAGARADPRLERRLPHGHGFWTSVENVIVGPFIAIISFVCSIGNVPLAAALWHGGISFGGVIASSSPT